MKSGFPETVTVNDWLIKNLSDGQRVGIDSTLISANEGISLAKALATKNIGLLSFETNPIDEMWGSNKPPIPNFLAFPHSDDFSGVTVNSKITQIQNILNENGDYGIVVSMLDEVQYSEQSM